MIDNKNERNKFRMGIQNLLDFDFVNTVIFIQSSPINNAIILDLFLFRFILAILFESLNSFHSLYFTGSFGPQSGLDLKIYDKKREIKIFYFSNSINFFHSLFFFILTSKQDFPSSCFNLLMNIQMGSWITPNPKSIQPNTET